MVGDTILALLEDVGCRIQFRMRGPGEGFREFPPCENFRLPIVPVKTSDSRLSYFGGMARIWPG